jgi:hypothetical protein
MAPGALEISQPGINEDGHVPALENGADVGRGYACSRSQETVSQTCWRAGGLWKSEGRTGVIKRALKELRDTAA